MSFDQRESRLFS